MLCLPKKLNTKYNFLSMCAHYLYTGEVISLFQFNECVVSKIPAKWKKVGVALELSQSRIDAIDHHRNKDPFECFSDVFHYWRNESTPERPANWATLISALRSNTVGEEALAEHIQSTLIGDTCQ